MNMYTKKGECNCDERPTCRCIDDRYCSIKHTQRTLYFKSKIDMSYPIKSINTVIQKSTNIYKNRHERQ